MQEANEDNTGWRRALRRDMVARRAALSEAEHDVLSARIVAHLIAALPAPRVVAFCWPIKHEPDVRAIVPHWAGCGTRAALPVVVQEGAPLAFRHWAPETPLEPDRYGIPTPMAGEWLIPDLILLPLNGFDGEGYRLGYGGGYFDRTLAALAPAPTCVGVAFELARCDSTHPQPHDKPMDWVVTEAGVFLGNRK